MLGHELKALRKQAGYGSGEIAAALGINPSTWSRYERGHLVVPVPVELALRYLHLMNSQPSAEERLITALKEVAGDQGTSERQIEIAT